MTNCEWCGNAFEPKSEGQRFCCAQHRSQWHQMHAPRGVVRSVRKLSRGGVSVTIHFDPTEAHAALKINPKELVNVGK